MSIAEQTTAPAPAELPAAVVTWLTAPGDEDTRVGVEQWGSALELTITRGPWEVYIAADGRTAGLEYTARGDAQDMGPEWAHALAELAELLRDPRLTAHVAAAAAERRDAWLAGPRPVLRPAEEGGR